MKNLALLTLLVYPHLFAEEIDTYTLTVEVENLRNDLGQVQFALYNKEASIPDEKYTKYFKINKEKINISSSKTVFTHLPKGKYAINILHDENRDGKIEKGFILPKEGIGFSHYSSIGPSNRPNFKKASFEISSNSEITVKIIYF